MVNKNLNSTKAQVWFTDFVIGMIVFSLVLISYYTYTTNISKQDSSATDNLISDAKIVSSSLTTRGYPDNWDVNTVTRIGFTDSYNRIDTTKFNEFNKLNYNDTKKLLGTIYDYFLFFVNESGHVQNVEGFCGTGIGEVNISYEITAAYFYQGGSGDDQFLREFMTDDFDADVFTHSGSGFDKDGNPISVTGTLCDLTNNMGNYGVVVLEAPEMSTGIPCGKFGAFKPIADDWVTSGGFLMTSGQLVAAQRRVIAGGEIGKGSGLSSSEEYALVVNEDEFLDFILHSGLIFDQGFNVVDVGATNFKDIARFNESELLVSEIENNQIAIARWEYGNGRVFFFSDFDTQYLAGDFQDILEASTKKWIGAQCLPINITNIKRDNLIRTDRLVIYKSDQIKMVLYLWD